MTPRLVVLAFLFGACIPPSSQTPSQPRPTAAASGACLGVDPCLARCGKNDGTSCWRLAVFVAIERPDQSRFSSIGETIERACRAGAARACAMAGTANCVPGQNGWSSCGPAAIDLFKLGCDGGDPE